MVCFYCNSNVAVIWGSRSYCSGCFYAGQRAQEQMFAFIQKHIEEETKK
jgi:hypothetical protein